MTRVLNRYRDRIPYDARNIDRSTPFGNPFTHLRGKTRAAVVVESREESLIQYERWFEDRIKDPEFRAKIETLRGHDLVCVCKPLSCHGDIIAEWLNKTQGDNNAD